MNKVNNSEMDEKEKTGVSNNSASNNISEEKNKQKTNNNSNILDNNIANNIAKTTEEKKEVSEETKETTEEKKVSSIEQQEKVVKKKRVKVKKVVEKILHKKEKRKLEGGEKRAFKLAYRMKRKKPKFIRQEFGKMKRLEKKWRKPIGIDSKLRVERKGRGFIVKIGYKKPDSIRFLHPTGFKPVRIFNTSSLEKIRKEEEAIVIASKVGRKKRNEIIKIANRLNINILNPRKEE